MYGRRRYRSRANSRTTSTALSPKYHGSRPRMPWNRAWDDSSPNCAQRMYSVGSGGSILSGFQKPPMSWLHMLMPERLRLSPERSAATIPPHVHGWSPVQLIG